MQMKCDVEYKTNEELLETLLLTCTGAEIEEGMRRAGEKNLQRLMEVKMFFGIVYEKIKEAKGVLKWN